MAGQAGQLSYLKDREELLEIAQQIWNRRLTNAAGGNLAVQVDEDRALVSPSMMSEHHRCNIALEDFILVDLNGKILEGAGKVSRETGMHLRLFKGFDYVKASVHAHPQFCMVFASQHKAVPSMTEATQKKGDSGVIPFTPAYTAELADNIYNYFDENRAKTEAMSLGLVMPMHGVICTGESLSAAFSMLERMETDATCAIFSKFI